MSKQPEVPGKKIHDALEKLQHSEVLPNTVVEFTPLQINLLREHFNDKKDITRIYIVDNDPRKVLFIDYKKDDNIHTILLH